MAFVSPTWAGGPRVRTAEAAKGLPVIDVRGLRSTSRHAQRQVADQIGRAAREVGMFYIHGHGIDPSLFARVYAQARAFFALSPDAKLRYHIAHSVNHRGYVPFSEKGAYADEQGERHYEAFDSALDLTIDHPAALASPLMGPNVWPELPEFRKTITEYYQTAAALGRLMCRAFELALGVRAGYFDRFMQAPTSQLRLLHYVENEAPPSAREQQNMGAHTDYECFTLLHQTAPGLQSMTVDGQWVDVPPIADTLVVNIGDMMEVWSNGLFVSNPHRVLNTGKERYSMPFFVATDFDAVVEPVPGAVTRQRPPGYAPVVAGEHLLSQLFRDFPYLRDRGELEPARYMDGSTFVNPFEQSKLGVGGAMEHAA